MRPQIWTYTTRNLRLKMLAEVCTRRWGKWLVCTVRWDRVALNIRSRCDYGYQVNIELHPADVHSYLYAKTTWREYLFLLWIRFCSDIKDKPVERFNDDCDSSRFDTVA